MAENAAEGEFRVTDRRRRVEEPEPAPALPREESVPPPAAGQKEESAPRAPQESEAGPPGRRGEPRSGPSAPVSLPSGDDRGLEGLFFMLASSAVVALGQTPDPVTGQVRDKDPEAAAGAIDLLSLLRAKTDGHRTPGETRLLDELIYDLQLRYVAATKPRL